MVGRIAQLLLLGEQVFGALLLRLDVLEVLLQSFRASRVFLLLLLLLGEFVDSVLEAFEQFDALEQFAQIRVAVLQQLKQRAKVGLQLAHDDQAFVPSLLAQQLAGVLKAVVQLLLLHEAKAGTQQLALFWLILLQDNHELAHAFGKHLELALGKLLLARGANGRILCLQR